MRRRLHALLVGVLAFSLAFDTAQACGHLRRSRGVRPCLTVPSAVPYAVPYAVPCAPAAWVVVPAPGWCGPVVVACDPWTMAGPCGVDACGPSDWAIETIDVLADGCAPPTIDTLGIPGHAECCGGEPVAAMESLPVEGAVESGEVVTESVVAQPPADAPTAAPSGVAESIVAPAAAPEIAPLTPAPTPGPDLKAVEPVSATEPAGPVELPPAEPPAVATEEPATPAAVAAEPSAAPAPESAVAEPAEPAQPPEPVEENIFEDATAAADVGETSSTPASEPVVGEATEPAIEPEPVVEPAPAVEAEPAVEPQAEPAAPEAAPEAATLERPRRWIDASGSFATVGALVAVRGGAVEIRTSTGRSIVVPLERLSEFDRGYADAAAARLAARAPGSRDTAGL